MCASLFLDDKHQFFTKDIEELKYVFRNWKRKNSLIVATNLQFDFFGVFGKEGKDISTLFSGTQLINAKIRLKTYKSQNTYLEFIDTMNYCMFSVEKQGEILKIPKLKHPEFFGKMPSSNHEWEIMKKYNMRDAEVSKQFLRFLYDSFEDLGASPKMTIASSTMSLFTNKHLETTYFPHEESITRWIFEGYYGGRTEAFKRGKIEGYELYDVNSLYPYVMQNFSYPDPNTQRESRENTLEYINNFEGMSDVTVETPQEINKPLLPFRTKDKLIFPTGKFRSKYTHPELRKAIGLGYKILKVHKSIYYKKTCRPFKHFVDSLYPLKEKYKTEKNPLVIVVKLLLNSLYGKFGQKFIGRENTIPKESLSAKQLNNLSLIEQVSEDYVRIKEDTKMPRFCFPIWASYITTYARNHLYDLFIESNAIYGDTDSIITRKEMQTGNGLGELTHEATINEGWIIRPKFYAMRTQTGDKIKVKGVGKRLNIKDFERILDGETVKYHKFVKFKESLRRNLKSGEIIPIEKQLSLNDSKREWFNPFDKNILQSSLPLNIYCDISNKEPISINTPLVFEKEISHRQISQRQR